MPACIVLPVELIYFDAKCDKNNLVQLQWQTASETNSDYFTVERSGNGNIFEAIGVVKAAGNSSTRRYYYFTDTLSAFKLYNLPAYYYRLKQVDKNGANKYLQIITAECKSPEPVF